MLLNLLSKLFDLDLNISKFQMKYPKQIHFKFSITITASIKNHI